MTTLNLLPDELAEDERWALFREYGAAVQNIDGHLLDRLILLGVPPGFWENCGAPGAAFIRRLPEGGFEFADDGEAAIILPIYGNETPAWAPLEQRFEGLLDLLVFKPAQPGHWWLRRSQAVLLGSIYIGLVLKEDCALPIYSNPLSWLKTDGEGVVVLDWEMAPALLLDVGEFLVEDVETGNRI